MREWALWMFGLLAFTAVCRIIVMGIVDYPRIKSRGADCVDLLAEVAFIVWGIFALWVTP